MRTITAEGEPAERDWQGEVKALLKAELKRRNVTYAQLAEGLSKLGVNETERNIRNKLSRGNFTAVFFFQCLEAVGADMFLGNKIPVFRPSGGLQR